MRKIHSDKFRFKVALEACSEQCTTQELSTKHNGLSPSLIHKWKTHLKNNGEKLFSKLPLTQSNPNKHHQQEVQKLHEQIGKLVIEKEYLKKNLED